MQNTPTKSTVLIILLWGLLIAVSGWVRPLYYSSEEMHYASIAWEMWQHHHFILPIQAGQPYAEKGPLLFWLIHLGWWLFGVSSWWMRLLPELFGLGTLFLLRQFIVELWPTSTADAKEHLVANLAPFILLGSFFFAAKIPMMRFDVITTFLVLLTLHSLIKAINKNKKYWLLFTVSMSLGLLTKGPVIFLFVLPAAITAKWWARNNYSWSLVYLLAALALLSSILLTCCWLIPAIYQGGADYATALLFSRSVGRIWYNGSYWQQNWFYYIFILMMMLLPWIIWPPFWQALVRFSRDIKRNPINRGLRLLFIIVGSAFIFLTFTAEKGPRYILPALPFIIAITSYILIKYQEEIQRGAQFLIALAYIIAGLLYALIIYLAPLKIQTKYPWIQDISPIWGCCLIALGVFWLLWRITNLTKIISGLAISTVLFWSFYNLGITKSQAHYGDWQLLAQQVRNLQLNNIPVAFTGSYQVLEFFGRLPQPLEPLTNKTQIKLWLEKHPEGWLVERDYKISPMQLKLIPPSNYQIQK